MPTSHPASRSYRCTYTPLDRDGYPQPNETGVLPTVQVRAHSAEQAQRAAYATVRAPIVQVERLECAA